MARIDYCDTSKSNDRTRELLGKNRNANIFRMMAHSPSHLEQYCRLGGAIRSRGELDPIVRERYAFACDIGSSRPTLERDWPDHDFGLIEETWWPQEEEPEASIIGRANHFRTTLAERRDWANTLVVSHWGFILSLTGKSVANGQWLRCDPTEPAPEGLVWRA